MKRPRVMVWGVCFAGVLLSGCSHAHTVLDSPAVSTPSAVEMAQPPQDASSGDLQNRKETQLVMLFQGLLDMDRQPGLAITKKQADAMLPFVRKSKDEGILNESEQKQVMDVLTAEQKSFLEDKSRQMKKRSLQRNDSGEMSLQERERRVEAFKKNRNADHPEATGSTNQAMSENPVTDDKGLGKSIEQQLIELLESKPSS